MNETDKHHSRIILASASPRRQEWLAKSGLGFEIKPTNVDERLVPGEKPYDAVRRVTLTKGLAAQADDKEAVIIAADTIVVHDGEILGKPVDEDDAVATLRRLRGKWHEVLTGLVVLRGAKQLLEIVKSQVLMRKYTNEEIVNYVASGDPLDKAGSYAVQNESFHPVAQIAGCYLNVVGLPLCALQQNLAMLGIEMPAPLPSGCLDVSKKCGFYSLSEP